MTWPTAVAIAVAAVVLGFCCWCTELQRTATLDACLAHHSAKDCERF